MGVTRLFVDVELGMGLEYESRFLASNGDPRLRLPLRGPRLLSRREVIDRGDGERLSIRIERRCR